MKGVKAIKRKDSIIYYNLRESAHKMGKSYQYLYNLVKYSEYLEAQGKERLIPAPVLINNVLHYNEEDIDRIKEIIETIRRGDMKEYNRKKSNTYFRLKEKTERLEYEVKSMEEERKKILSRLFALEMELRDKNEDNKRD